MATNRKTSSINLLTAGLIGITITSGLTLTFTYVFANNIVDDIAITVPIACTMDSNGINGHTTEIVNGTYKTDIGTTTIKVLCNDNSGFSIYATGFTNETIGETNSNKLIGTNASGNATIDTGTATSGNTSNWAMKLATSSTATYPITLSAGYDDYHAVPNEWTKVATRLAGTDVGLSAEGATLTTTYAAYISNTQAADTYSGKVKYTLVHPNDELEPPRAPVSCPTKVPNLTYMQDLNSSNKASVLASMTEDEQYYLADRRDNKSYCVAKLKDGNIWMTQNLDLDLDSTKTYTPQDTDIPSNWQPAISTYPTGTTTWNKSTTTPESYDSGERYWNPNYNNELTLANEYYYSCENGACDISIYEQLSSSDWKAYFDSCDTGTLNNCDRSLLPSPAPSTGDSHYHLGNYYNWTAAIAMNDSSSYTTDGQDANRSICPANWTLPKGGNNTSSGSFYYLISQYGWDSSSKKMENPTIWDSPIKIPLNGLWQGTEQGRAIGEWSSFWSSMTINNSVAYLLLANNNSTIYLDGIIKSQGFPIRCLAR